MTRPQDRRGRPAKATKLQSLCEPVWIAVTTSLALKPRSATDLAEELDLPIEKVRYLLKCLRSEGLVSLHSERPRRGAIERVYMTDLRATLDYENQLVENRPDERRLFYDAMLRQIFREVLGGIRAGAFRRDREHAVIRAPLTLDDEGFEELKAVFAAAIGRLFSISEESLERIETRGATPIPTLSCFLNFEQID